ALRERPELASRVFRASRVGDRRWDLRLDNGVHILLPEDRLGPALDFLQISDYQAALLDGKLKRIDMRAVWARKTITVVPESGAERRLSYQTGDEMPDTAP
ncbi:MAG: cell division protein FtsQ/DivIB, partial [Pseudomonadota bacterium]